MYEKTARVREIHKHPLWSGGFFIITDKNKSAIDTLRPIPLTAEWIEKFGFDKLPNQNKYDMDKFWACKLRNGNEWHFEDLECIVKYVHQLQNLYFALTGEELAIKILKP